MAQAVHDLPLIMGESREHEKIFKVICFVVNKVVPNSNDSDQLKSSNSCKEIRQVCRILHVY